MGSHIPVHDPTCGDVKEDEHVQPLKRGRHHQEEVAREQGACMILKEGAGLGRSTVAWPRSLPYVATHGARRDGETRLEAQLRGETLLPPYVRLRPPWPR